MTSFLDACGTMNLVHIVIRLVKYLELPVMMCLKGWSGGGLYDHDLGSHLFFFLQMSLDSSFWIRRLGVTTRRHLAEKVAQFLGCIEDTGNLELS